MKDIPIPNWLPLALVALLFLVLLRSPLPEGEFIWHVAAAAGVLIYGMMMLEAPGAVKLLAAMALWIGFNGTLAAFIMLWSLSGLAVFYLHKLLMRAPGDTYPALPFALFAFVATLPYAPIWPHILGAPAAISKVDAPKATADQTTKRTPAPPRPPVLPNPAK